MNPWFSSLLNLTQAVPYLVSGIENVHSDAKSGADKKQLAMEALGIATAGASVGVPQQYQDSVKAASGLASNLIDSWVGLFNSFGWPAKQSRDKAANPVPASSEAVAVSSGIFNNKT